MKQMKIFVLFVFCVVEIFATVEARYVDDLPHAGVQPSDVKNVWSDLKEFLDSSDSKSSEHPVPNDEETTCVNVNDSISGIIGEFCLTLSYSPSSGGLVSLLTVNGNILYGSYEIADVLDSFLGFGCGESRLTRGQSICLATIGNRTRADQRVSCCAALLRIGKPTVVIGNFGCFSLNYDDANADGMMNGSPTDAKEFLDLLAAEEKRIPLKKRILMKNNFPRMEDEKL